MKKKPEVTKRLAPTKDTLTLLYSLSGNQCAFPGCTHKIFNEKNKLIAQVCHIESAMEGGERFNSASNNQSRRLYPNLLILCYQHHVETDDVDEFPTERMRKIKEEHESQFRGDNTIPNQDLIDELYNQQIQLLEEIRQDTQMLNSKADEHKIILDSQTSKMDEMFEFIKQSQGASEGSFSDRIDEILLLRNTNQQKTGILLFNQLKKDSWQRLNDHEKYRLLANLGLFHHDMLETDLAANLFLEAYSFQPHNQKAIPFGVLGHSIKGDHASAAILNDKLLQLDGSNASGYSAMIRLDSETPIFKLIDRIPKHLHSNTEISYEIARRFSAERNLSAAISWIRKILKRDGSDSNEIISFLATLLFETIYNAHKLNTGQFSLRVRETAREIINLYTEAWDKVKSTDLRESRYWYLINRGLAKKYLDNTEGAYEDAMEAYIIHCDETTLRHLTLACLETERHDKSIEFVNLLKNVVQPDQREEIDFFEAEILMRLGHQQQSIKIAEKILAYSTNIKNRTLAMDFMFNVLLSLDDVKEAEKYSSMLIKEQPKTVLSHVNKAKLHLSNSNVALASTALNEAYTNIGDDTAESEKHQLAKLLVQVQDYPKAISILEDLVDMDVYSSNSRELLKIYYDSGNYEKLLKLSRGLRDIYGPISYLTELICVVYVSMKDYRNAISTCTTHLDVYPEDQFIIQRLAIIYEKLHQKEKLRTLLATIDHLDKSLSMHAQFRMAVLNYKAGNVEKYRRYTLATRHQFYNTVECHEVFVSLNFDLAEYDREPSNPDTVVLDSAVVLERDTQKFTFILSSARELRRANGEVSIDSSEGRSLLGKTIGDKVVFDNTDMSFEVIEIVDGYNFAMKQSFELIGSTFANQTRFKQVKIGNSGDVQADFKLFFDIIGERSDWLASVDKVYKEQNFPIATIAEIYKTHPIRMWSKYISEPEFRIHTSSNRQEIATGMDLLHNCKQIVIDLFTVCTVAQIDAFAILEMLPTDKLISQSTIDSIRGLITELEEGSKQNFMSFAKIKGTFYKSAPDPIQSNNQIDHLKNILIWCEKNCNIVPADASLKINAHEKIKLDQAVGEVLADELLLAEDRNAVFISEEASVRSIASEMYKINSVNLFTVLLFMQDRKLIPIDIANTCTIALIGLGFQNIPLTTDILIQICEKTHYKMEWPLTYALENIAGGLTSDAYTCMLVTGFFMQLYLHRPSVLIDSEFEALRTNIIVKTLEQLSKRYNLSSLKDVILLGLNQAIPHRIEEIRQVEIIISNYIEGREL
jgi:tetratricopeptide (TPR) repeat protein